MIHLLADFIQYDTTSSWPKYRIEHHQPYSPMNKSKQIVSADDDRVEDQLLQWAGLDDAWDRYELTELENFVRLAESAKHIDIDFEDWDADMPGRSGTWHTVSTRDEAALKKELRGILAGFIWKNRRKIHRILARSRAAEEERRIRQAAADAADPDCWYL